MQDNNVPESFAQKQKSKQKQKNKVAQFTTIKRAKINNYPYYPVTFAMTKNDFSYIFNLDFYADVYTLAVSPIKIDKQKSDYLQLNSSIIELECMPKRACNILYVLSYEDTINPNSNSIVIKHIQFIVGFSAGYLIRLRYTNSQKVKRQLVILEKYNRKPDYKQGLMMRMTSSFFGSDQFYKVAIEKPVRTFEHYPRNKDAGNFRKFTFSYLIGNRLYLCKQLSEQTQNQAIKTFNNIQWDDLPQNSQAKLQKMSSIVIKCRRYKALNTSNCTLIEWTNQITSYQYTSKNELIIADNEENNIIVYDVLDNLTIRCIYSFDMDIKRINYLDTNFMGQQQKYLLVMPYDTNIFVINLSSSLVCSIKGHRSYIGQATLTKNGYLITGGCDHRIGLKNIKQLSQWTPIQLTKGNKQFQIGTKYYQIQSSLVPRLKMQQTYFLGQFNNVNSQRNNSNGFGFGNFLPIPGTDLYAFLTYDFVVKVYKFTL